MAPLYIDVRSAEEVALVNLPGAINIDLQTIAHAVAADTLPEQLLGVSLDTPIVVFCASGGRAGMAVHILKHAGFTDVSNGGGVEDVRNDKSRQLGGF